MREGGRGKKETQITSVSCFALFRFIFIPTPPQHTQVYSSFPYLKKKKILSQAERTTANSNDRPNPDANQSSDRHPVVFCLGLRRQTRSGTPPLPDTGAPHQCLFLTGHKQHIKTHSKLQKNIHYRHFDGFDKSENAAGSRTTCQPRD